MSGKTGLRRAQRGASRGLRGNKVALMMLADINIGRLGWVRSSYDVDIVALQRSFGKKDVVRGLLFV